MENLNGELDAVVQAKIDGDTDFIESIANLSDEDKTTAINEKREEIIKEEWKNLTEFAKTRDQVAKDKEAWAKKLEKDKKDKPTPQGDDLSPKDWMYLAKADVHDDDIDRVVKFSKLEGITVQEALKHSDLKAIISSRAEARKSAEAISVKPSSRGAQKPNPEVIVAEAAKGKIPQAGTPEAEELFWARRGGRR